MIRKPAFAQGALFVCENWACERYGFSRQSRLRNPPQSSSNGSHFTLVNNLRELVWTSICSAIFIVVPVSAHESTGLQVTPAEYEVFSAYISEQFTGKAGINWVGRDVSEVIIDGETKSFEGAFRRFKTSEWLRREAPALKKETIKAFVRAQHRSALQRAFRLPVDYQLVHSGDIEAILKGGFPWKDYYDRHPGSQGIMCLSRVGFSRDGRQAIFFAANYCGSKCGRGSYVVMEKLNSTWKTLKKVTVWSE